MQLSFPARLMAISVVSSIGHRRRTMPEPHHNCFLRRFLHPTFSATSSSRTPDSLCAQGGASCLAAPQWQTGTSPHPTAAHGKVVDIFFHSDDLLTNVGWVLLFWLVSDMVKGPAVVGPNLEMEAIIMSQIRFPVIDTAATGANIVRLRRERGLTVRDLQQFFGFEEPQAIYKWQRGKSLPNVDNLYALSALFRVPMNEILVSSSPYTFSPERQAEPCGSFFLAGRSGHGRISRPLDPYPPTGFLTDALTRSNSDSGRRVFKLQVPA